MNRPRNRQPRQHNQAQQNSHGQNHNRHDRRKQAIRVPNMSQVLPGAGVSIVLKADQPTGREVQGVVSDVLTRGDHPRGIKVRLKDGRVGRVQRMMSAGEVTDGAADRWPTSLPTSPVNAAGMGGQRWPARDQAAGHGDMPPPRSLADFIPDNPDEPPPERPARPDQVVFASAEIKCPFCSTFEGDEAAVSFHVEQAHLS